MSTRGAGVRWLVLVLFAVVGGGICFGQGKTAQATNAFTQRSAEDVGPTRDQLIQLLRLNPKSAAIIAHDPSLLGDAGYVSRNNPNLAEFLQSHPEVARNPEFYLFANINPDGRGTPATRLESEVWPELSTARDPWVDFVSNDLTPFMVFVLIGSGLIWLIRTLLEHRRWNRTFAVQTDIYNKLLDKFASNEELIAYVQSEAGKRFLASATLPQVPETRTSSAVSRVLTPMQIGVVMTLAGIALLFLYYKIGGATPLLGLGTLAIALGLGFMISAGLAWALANKLGIVQLTPAGQNGASSDHRTDF